MKKSFFPLLLAAVVLLSTSCIKNEESEGVKSMRTSQASLLSAMATATTTAATADAALKAAQAALTTAQADIQKNESAAKIQQMTIANANATENNRHNAAVNALNESLQAASDARTKANLTLQIAEEAAQSAFNLKHIANQQTMLDAQIAANKNENDIAVINAKLALDKAQKDYDFGLQQQAKTFTDQLASLKSQVTADILIGYQSAYGQWTNKLNSINNLKQNLAYSQQNLLNDKAADAQYVTNAQSQLDYDNKQLAKYQDDLAKFKAALPSTDGTKQLIATYQAEALSLTDANNVLNQNIAASQKIVDNFKAQLDQLTNSNYNGSSFGNGSYDILLKAQSDKNNLLLTATSYKTMATNYTTATDGYFNVYNYTTKSTEYNKRAGYQPKVAGVNSGSRVALKDAVTNAAANTLSTDADKAEAQTAYDAAIKYVNDATDDVSKAQIAADAAKAAVDAAKPAVDAVKAQLADAITKLDANGYVYTSDQSQLRRNNSRLQIIGGSYYAPYGYIQQLTSSLNSLNYTDQTANATMYYSSITSQITYITSQIKYDTTNYDNAVKSFNQNLPYNQINYDSLQTQIDTYNAELATEQTGLALLKATLDEWVAKIKAALPKN